MVFNRALWTSKLGCLWVVGAVQEGWNNFVPGVSLKFCDELRSRTVNSYNSGLGVGT